MSDSGKNAEDLQKVMNTSQIKLFDVNALAE